MQSYIASYFLSILILWKEYIFGRIRLYVWGFGEELNYFQGFGERRQILLGRRGHYLLGDDGEIIALFSGIKGAQTPWGPHFLGM